MSENPSMVTLDTAAEQSKNAWNNAVAKANEKVDQWFAKKTARGSISRFMSSSIANVLDGHVTQAARSYNPIIQIALPLHQLATEALAVSNKKVQEAYSPLDVAVAMERIAIEDGGFEVRQGNIVIMLDLSSDDVTIPMTPPPSLGDALDKLHDEITSHINDKFDELNEGLEAVVGMAAPLIASLTGTDDAPAEVPVEEEAPEPSGDDDSPDDDNPDDDPDSGDDGNDSPDGDDKKPEGS